MCTHDMASDSAERATYSLKCPCIPFCTRPILPGRSDMLLGSSLMVRSPVPKDSSRRCLPGLKLGVSRATASGRFKLGGCGSIWVGEL